MLSRKRPREDATTTELCDDLWAHVAGFLPLADLSRCHAVARCWLSSLPAHTALWARHTARIHSHNIADVVRSVWPWSRVDLRAVAATYEHLAALQVQRHPILTLRPLRALCLSQAYDSVVPWFRSEGHHVQELQLDGSDWPCERLYAVLRHCTRLRQLDLTVHTHSPDPLPPLPPLLERLILRGCGHHRWLPSAHGLPLHTLTCTVHHPDDVAALATLTTLTTLDLDVGSQSADLHLLQPLERLHALRHMGLLCWNPDVAFPVLPRLRSLLCRRINRAGLVRLAEAFPGMRRLFVGKVCPGGPLPPTRRFDPTFALARMPLVALHLERNWPPHYLQHFRHLRSVSVSHSQLNGPVLPLVLASCPRLQRLYAINGSVAGHLRAKVRDRRPDLDVRVAHADQAVFARDADRELEHLVDTDRGVLVDRGETWAITGCIVPTRPA